MLKKILNYAGIVVLYLIGMLPIINCGVAIYWLFDQYKRKKSIKEHPLLTLLIYLSTFPTMYIILVFGVYKCLFFIPYSWGDWDEVGEWYGYRQVIAAFVCFFGPFFIARIFWKYEELYDKVEKLKRKNDELTLMVEMYKDEYESNDEDSDGL